MEFFKHETLSHPPSLSKHGVIRPGDKFEFIPILKKLAEESKVPSDLPGVDCLVIEGAAIVNQLKPLTIPLRLNGKIWR